MNAPEYRAERLNPETRKYEFVGDATTEVEASAMINEYREALGDDFAEYRIRPIPQE